MRATSASKHAAGQGEALLAVVTASLFHEIRAADEGGERPRLDVVQMRDVLTGQASAEHVNVEQIIQAAEYWNNEVNKMHSLDEGTMRTYLNLKQLDAWYKWILGQQAEANRQILRSRPAAGASEGTSLSVFEIHELASTVAHQLREGGDAKEGYAKLKAACADKVKAENLGGREASARMDRPLIIAHTNRIKLNQMLDQVRRSARRLLDSPEGKAINYILPQERERLCHHLNLVDPALDVPPHVRYLMDHGKSLEAQIVAYKRKLTPP